MTEEADTGKERVRESGEIGAERIKEQERDRELER